MKLIKLLIVILLVVAMSNCEVSTPKANASSTVLDDINGTVILDRKTIDGMEYIVFRYGNGITVINHTIEKLEYKLMLREELDGDMSKCNHE